MTVRPAGRYAKRMRTALEFVVSTLVLCSAGCTSPGDGKKTSLAAALPRSVGFVGSLTGRSASFGTSAKNGVELALLQRGAPGSKERPPLRAIYLDDQGRPEDARQAAQRLITKEKVELILGALESGTSLAMAEVVERARVPMLSPAATLPSLTRAGRFVFRACYTDEFQGRAMARFVREQLGLQKVAILRAVHNEYSVELSNVFAKEFERIGGRVLIDEAYVYDEADLESTLRKVAAAAPEAVFIPGYYDEVSKIAPALRKVGLTAPLLGADGWDSDRLLDEAASAVEGSYFTSHFHPDLPGAHVSGFVAAYEKLWNETPDALAALGYDAAMVALAALDRVPPGAGGDALRTSLAQTRGYEGVTGTISFNEDGDAEKRAVVLRIEGGRRVYVTSIGPALGVPGPN